MISEPKKQKFSFYFYKVFQKIMAKQMLYLLRHAFALCLLTEWFFA
jgi:hypothetical protein